MGRPGAIVTHMNSHGWIFCGAYSAVTEFVVFSKHSQSSLCSQVCRLAGAGDRVATGLV
jgi:hypothetical protein